MTGTKYKGEAPINTKCCKEIDQQHSKQFSLELEKKMQQKLMIVTYLHRKLDNVKPITELS